MVTLEMIERRIKELEQEADQYDRLGSFGLARVKRSDIRYYRALRDEALTRETHPKVGEVDAIACDPS